MKVKSAAVRHPCGRVSVGKKHRDIPGMGKEGFVTDTGKFVNRKEAGKIARKAGQVKKMKTKYLHSGNLK